MAKKADKKESLSSLSPKELESRLKETQESYFRLRFRHATSPLKNPMEIRTARKMIARLRTLIRQKEVSVS